MDGADGAPTVRAPGAQSAHPPPIRTVRTVVRPRRVLQVLTPPPLCAPGSGKTETNKHVLAYLRWRAMDGEGGTAQKISEIIGQSNVLLEALGNAKTTNK